MRESKGVTMLKELQLGCLILLVCFQGGWAGKDKEVEKTEEPSVDPGNTYAPSLVPTAEPSIFAIEEPSPAPAPPSLPAPTKPSSENTDDAAYDGKYVVDLPKMEFELTFPEQTVVKEKSLHQVLEAFFNNFLSQNSANRETFVKLTFETSLEEYNQGVAQVNCAGRATFTERNNDLEKMIITYFSFWGVKDLQKNLYGVGLPVTDILVKINGEEVQPQGDDDDLAAADGSTAAGDVSETESAAPVDIKVVGIAVIAVIALLMFAGTLWIICKKRNRTNEELKKIALESSGSGETINFSCSPTEEPQHLRIIGPALSTPSTSPNRRSQTMPDDIKSFSGIMSVEDSLFTATDGGDSRQPNVCTYDARRLDHVIESAKGLTQREVWEETLVEL